VALQHAAVERVDEYVAVVPSSTMGHPIGFTVIIAIAEIPKILGLIRHTYQGVHRRHAMLDISIQRVQE